MLFHAHGRQEVTAAFDGGRITSDGGGLLLREVEERFGIVRSFVGCFTDHRDPEAIEFSVRELLLQRVMGLALGYEDLNDHDDLRRDPLLALLAGRKDLTGDEPAASHRQGRASRERRQPAVRRHQSLGQAGRRPHARRTASLRPR